MGLTIHLQDEKGRAFDTVTDERNLLHKILPQSDDLVFRSINRIDWYGDTTFNRMQMEDLIHEFNQLNGRPFSLEEKALVDEIVALAKRGIERPHFYLRFCGD